MKKFILVLMSAGIAASSALAGILTTKNFYTGVINELREERRLQGIAYNHMLLIQLDNDELEKTREEVLKQFNALVLIFEPLEAYPDKHQEACAIHKTIHEYRRSRPDNYVPRGGMDDEVENILEAWGAADCI